MISLIIPAFNEEEAIVDTIQEAQRALASTDLTPAEVIIVDDGSTDKTGERASASGARVVRHPHNVGYGRSLKDGIRAAKYDTVVISDADGTYPIGAIPLLLQEYQNGFDMIVGARTGQYYHGPGIKTPLRYMLKLMVEFTAGRKVPDVNSGLRVFSKATVEPYFPHLCDTFSFTTSLTLAYMMTGKFVLHVPIAYNKRVGKTKVRLIRDALRTMQFIIEAILYYNPIKIFILFSFACLLLSVVGFAASALFGILTGFLLGVGGILLAMLVFCMGLLAVLLKQIMDR
jgi:glycosyltransferase involved in cell wall biosynthesis